MPNRAGAHSAGGIQNVMYYVSSDRPPEDRTSEGAGPPANYDEGG